MTQQEIEDFILVRLYLTRESKPSTVEELLAANEASIPSLDQVQIIESLVRNHFVSMTSGGGRITGEITKRGIERVERNLKEIYITPKLNWVEGRKLLQQAGYPEGSYDFFKPNENFFEVSINQPTNPQTYFKFRPRLNSYDISYNPGDEVLSWVTPREAINHFHRWMDNLKKLPPAKVYQKFILATEPNDAGLLEIGFGNQGLIGYMPEEGDYTEPLIEFESKQVLNKYIYSVTDERWNIKQEYSQRRKIGYVSTVGIQKEEMLQLKCFELENSYLFATNVDVDSIPFMEASSIFPLDVFLFRTKGENRAPLYVYSNIPGKRYFEPLKPIAEEPTTKPSPVGDKELNEITSLQGDGPTAEDKLQREPFVDALRNYILKYWDETGARDSYTIHLDGEWGSGKSSILDMLESKLSEKSWVVVRYNAWQNQHLENPWWVFLHRIFKTIKSNSSGCKLWWFDLKWRILRPNQGIFLSFLVVLMIFFLLIWVVGFNWVIPLNQSVDNAAKLLATLITIVGALWISSNFVINLLTTGSSKPGESFYKKLSDPMENFKEYFRKTFVIGGMPLAILIDDLDRCDIKPTVNLLEGIQTLYKDQKVLYIIAGDGRWISKCFERHYSSFQELARPGYSLGHLFLAKVFQMSVSVPKMSPEAKTHYLRHLLKLKAGDIKVTEEKTSIEKQKIENATTEKQLSDILVANKEQSDINLQELRASASKKLSEIDLEEDLGHILLNYEKDFDPNARNMKRFINNYALHRNALFLSGQTLEDISPEDLIRWLFIESKWPTYAYELKDAPEKVEQIKNSNSAFKVFTDGWLEPELIQKLR